ncbi:response regulator transcription factor [Flavobacterium subsaxonicum]|uniref:Transcriptional regulator n=1 Tax=Flavobacterium subsaxonicum WB 4.1-42 = DSM 21790 TaxID=1121898 RepID=A0A0A2N190_9FLAO|nr:response regulator transcription factor [Flavobacterium subsaxonicum]KGO94210.1 transcriptional regulator [Flavobacterium subsaxonicum WB 4.1-42 = DSM 21790]
MKHILLAEDDFDYASILKQYLEISGFRVTWAKDGAEALAVFAATQPDICVFDVMMPKMDGFTLAENIITDYPETPIVFLTAKGLKEDKIKGLKLGADDYVVKPFEADELILRINNILRRTQRSAPVSANNKQQITIGGYTFNTANYTLSFNNIVHRLTEKEVHLISYLNNNRNRLLKREDILTEIWGSDDFFSGRSMDVFISRLRKYFNEDPGITITGYRGLGLEFNVAQ